MDGFDNTFYSAASDFCTLIENNKRFSRDDIFKKLREILPALYYLILQNKETEPDNEVFVQQFVTEEDWNNVYRDLKEKIGPADNYLELADRRAFNTDDVLRYSLSEDLADLYQVFKDYMSNYDIGSPDVIDDLNSKSLADFNEYWSETLLNALRTININISKPLPENEMNIEEEDNGENWFWSDNFNFLKSE